MPDIDQIKHWYSETSSGHQIDHVLRVLNLAHQIHDVEGGDWEIIRMAVLLHDVKDSNIERSSRQLHHLLSADFASQVLRSEGWQEERISAVRHCIRCHRFRATEETPTTIEAQIVYDADKLDAIGAIGVARAIAFVTLAQQPVFTDPTQHFLASGECEPDEPHSAYHEYLIKLMKIKDLLLTPTARQIAATRHDFMVRYFQQLAAEIHGEI